MGVKFRNKAVNGITALLLIVLVIAILAFGPWVAMWTIGVLFGVFIDFNLKTWFAMLLLLALVRGGSSSK